MQAATKVNAKAFVEQGLQGIEIKEAMAKARLLAIKSVKQQHQVD
jgi:tRNA nucleotidyltransferase (CCA-adding enzyme)